MTALDNEPLGRRAAAEPTTLTLESPEHKQPSMVKVAVATTVGTTVEYYDFFIYGTAAALVFPTVFFGTLGEAGAMMASFATFAVAFFARPVGAMVFGHIGDRFGRRFMMLASMALMSVAMLITALLPTHASIGAAAGWLMLLLRVLMAFSVGGEYTGVVAYLMIRPYYG